MKRIEGLYIGLAALAAAPFLAAAPETVQGPLVVTTGQELFASGTDGVETSGDVDVDGGALVVLATDGDSVVRLAPGFQAAPGPGGQVWAGTLGPGETYNGFGLSDLILMNDVDGDGMPDFWELLYGLDRHFNDAAGDLDGDGSSNKAEYDAEEDPTARNDWYGAPAAPSGSYGTNPILIVDPSGVHHDLDTSNYTLD